MSSAFFRIRKLLGWFGDLRDASARHAKIPSLWAQLHRILSNTDARDSRGIHEDGIEDQEQYQGNTWADTSFLHSPWSSTGSIQKIYYQDVKYDNYELYSSFINLIVAIIEKFARINFEGELAICVFITWLLVGNTNRSCSTFWARCSVTVNKRSTIINLFENNFLDNKWLLRILLDLFLFLLIEHNKNISIH